MIYAAPPFKKKKRKFKPASSVLLIKLVQRFEDITLEKVTILPSSNPKEPEIPSTSKSLKELQHARWRVI